MLLMEADEWMIEPTVAMCTRKLSIFNIFHLIAFIADYTCHPRFAFTTE